MVGHLFPTPKSHALALSWWGASGSMGFVYVDSQGEGNQPRLADKLTGSGPLLAVYSLHWFPGVGYVFVFVVPIDTCGWLTTVD